VVFFFIGKQKVILFPKYRENDWETATGALKTWSIRNELRIGILYNYLNSLDQIKIKLFNHLSD
jgi:hypothetical protein